MIFKLLYIITINYRSLSFQYLIPRMDYHFTLCFDIFVNMKATKSIISFRKHNSNDIHQSKIFITYYYLRICINSHKQPFNLSRAQTKLLSHSASTKINVTENVNPVEVTSTTSSNGSLTCLSYKYHPLLIQYEMN